LTLLRFILSVSAATFLLALLTWVGAQQGWWTLPTSWIEILFFILFITLVVYYNLNKLNARQPEAFTQFYLLSIALKMFGSLALIFFIVWNAPSAAVGNVTLFIVSYLTLTFLEVFFLLRRSAK
jgi:hypothetical protein